jgi:hypothetical protein
MLVMTFLPKNEKYWKQKRWNNALDKLIKDNEMVLHHGNIINWRKLDLSNRFER